MPFLAAIIPAIAGLASTAAASVGSAIPVAAGAAEGAGAGLGGAGAGAAGGLGSALGGGSSLGAAEAAGAADAAAAPSIGAGVSMAGGLPSSGTLEGLGASSLEAPSPAASGAGVSGMGSGSPLGGLQKILNPIQQIEQITQPITELLGLGGNKNDGSGQIMPPQFQAMPLFQGPAARDPLAFLRGFNLQG